VPSRVPAVSRPTTRTLQASKSYPYSDRLIPMSAAVALCTCYLMALCSERFIYRALTDNQLISSLQPVSGVCPVRRHIVHIAGSRVGSQTIVGELHSPKYN
jgi:hypothetical protein